MTQATATAPQAAAAVSCAELVLDVGIKLGESPMWSAVDKLLYFVDIDGKAIHSYDPSSGQHVKELDLTAMVSAVSPDGHFSVT